MLFEEIISHKKSHHFYGTNSILFNLCLFRQLLRVNWSFHRSVSTAPMVFKKDARIRVGMQPANRSMLDEH